MAETTSRLHFCRGGRCAGIPWPADFVPHPRTCDHGTWPGRCGEVGELRARVHEHGVVVVEVEGRVLGAGALWRGGLEGPLEVRVVRGVAVVIGPDGQGRGVGAWRLDPRLLGEPPATCHRCGERASRVAIDESGDARFACDAHAGVSSVALSAAVG